MPNDPAAIDVLESAISRLHGRIDQLEAQLQASEQHNAELEARIASLEAAAGVQPPIIVEKKNPVDDVPF